MANRRESPTKRGVRTKVVDQETIFLGIGDAVEVTHGQKDESFLRFDRKGIAHGASS
jgi:hypothetical protein